MTILSENMQSALALARGNRGRAKGDDARSHILLRPSDTGLLSVLCADGTTQTEVVFQGSIDQPVAVAPQLFELVQTLKAGVNIKLTPTDSATCKVQTGKSRFTLPTRPAADFPLLESEGAETAKFSIKAHSLAKALESASRGMGKPVPAKPFTGGVLLKCTDKGVYLVGTSGFTLVNVGVGAQVQPGTKTQSGVIPEMGISQIQRLASTAAADQRIEFELGDRQVTAKLGGATVRSRLISCKFPDYEQVTAVQDPFSLELSRSSLLEVLKRVGLFVQESSPFVSIKVEKAETGEWKLVCSVKTPQGECVESIDLVPGKIKLRSDGLPSAEAHLNITYLASILDAMPDDSVIADFSKNTLRVRGASQTLNVVGIAAYYRA